MVKAPGRLPCRPADPVSSGKWLQAAVNVLSPDCTPRSAGPARGGQPRAVPSAPAAAWGRADTEAASDRQSFLRAQPTCEGSAIPQEKRAHAPVHRHPPVSPACPARCEVLRPGAAGPLLLEGSHVARAQDRGRAGWRVLKEGLLKHSCFYEKSYTCVCVHYTRMCPSIL